MVVRWQRNCPQLERLKCWKACNRKIETCSKRDRQIETRVTDRQIETPGRKDRQIETPDAKPIHSQLDRLKRWKACNRQIETCRQTDRQIETPCGRDRQIETLEAKSFQLGRHKSWTMRGTDRLKLPAWRKRLLREPGWTHLPPHP